MILIATGFNGSALKNGESSIINSLFSKPPMAEEVAVRNPVIKESEAAVAEKSAKENKKEQDVWDIPTFLRKKK